MRLPILVVSLLVLGSGCASRGIPGYSLARYARANSGETVRLVGAASGGYGREVEPATPGASERETLAIPLAETGGTYRLHELYGVSVTVSPGLLSLEGQLRFGNQDIALGILHGGGVGVTALGNDPVVQINIIGGVFAQLGIDHQNYILVGARYVFDDLHGGTPSGTPENGTHWISGGIGWLGQLFQFFGIGLEVHGGLNVRVDGGPTAWFILPTATVSAAF